MGTKIEGVAQGINVLLREYQNKGTMGGKSVTHLESVLEKAVGFYLSNEDHIQEKTKKAFEKLLEEVIPPEEAPPPPPPPPPLIPREIEALLPGQKIEVMKEPPPSLNLEGFCKTIGIAVMVNLLPSSIVYGLSQTLGRIPIIGDIPQYVDRGINMIPLVRLVYEWGLKPKLKQLSTFSPLGTASFAAKGYLLGYPFRRILRALNPKPATIQGFLISKKEQRDWDRFMKALPPLLQKAESQEVAFALRFGQGAPLYFSMKKETDGTFSYQGYGEGTLIENFKAATASFGARRRIPYTLRIFIPLVIQKSFPPPLK